ncbi:hypothetical protein [Roseibium sp. RKSG952]|uniref:hypothetical protein n=1 Tax=Roseibium sp. RKSG952 TaxID=2529384 RepID=UPI0012BC8DEB|nr:hypothetical protein [Roseibium sp. RKSG952]MTH97613.1 hypothetical protein [Roseibium sp. RKSG952]
MQRRGFSAITVKAGRRAALCAALLLAPMLPAEVNGQSLSHEVAVGWVPDLRGLRHFSGLRCPDTIGSASRTKVLAADMGRMAGCVYAARGDMTAVLRQHRPGTGHAVAREHLKAYRLAGFEKVDKTGIAAGGISFKTRPWNQEEPRCETLWYFEGANADYSLWLSYPAPEREDDLVWLVNGFRHALAALQ